MSQFDEKGGLKLEKPKGTTDVSCLRITQDDRMAADAAMKAAKTRQKELKRRLRTSTA